MIRAFADARPHARDRGRLPDHEHRDRGRRHASRAARPGPRVDDAVAPPRRPHRQGRQGRGHARADDIDPYALASMLTGSLEGGLMLSRLYDDPTHMDRVVDHLVAHVETLRAEPKERPRMTALTRRSHEGVRSRTISVDRSRARRASAARPRRVRTTASRWRRGEAAATAGRRAARHAARRGRARPHRVLASSPTRCTRTRWERCTAGSSRRSSTPRWVARCSSMLPADAGFTTLELKTNFVRADHADDRTRATPKVASCTSAGASRPPKPRPRRERHALRARDVDVPDQTATGRCA